MFWKVGITTLKTKRSLWQNNFYVRQKAQEYSYQKFSKILRGGGCKHIRTNGSHEIWARNDLKRPIVIPVNKKEIKEYVVKNTLNNLGMNQEEFWEYYDKKSAKKSSEQSDDESGEDIAE